MLEIGDVVIVHPPALRMLVIQLHEDDRAALIDLVGRDDGHDLGVPLVAGIEIRGGGGFPQREARLEQQPLGVPAIVPL